MREGKEQEEGASSENNRTRQSMGINTQSAK